MKQLIVICIVFLAIAGGLLYFIEIKPRQVRANCWNNAYAPFQRQHENDFEWAKGKKWLPKPGSDSVMTKDYVWIYPDQDDTTSDGYRANEKLAMQRQAQYDSCLKSNGY